MTNKNIFSNIDNYCKLHALLPKQSTIILGLSGGPDSLFLLHYLAEKHKQSSINLIAAHLDHEWRANSFNDANFCHKATSDFGIPLITARASELSFKPKFKGSKEELGRALRRHFFQTILKENNADRIALAHQMNDQQETFFIRMVRGSSLTGLCCMRPIQGPYIRPLLCTRRIDIINYLDEHQIAYLTDPSNESVLFLRNRIRHNLLPVIRTIDQRFDHNFAHMLCNLQETEDFLTELAQKSFKSISILSDQILYINTKDFMHYHPILQKRIVMIWLCHEQVPFNPSEAFIDEIIKFLGQQAGATHQLHQTWAITKHHKLAHIIKKFADKS